jgi:hypothetical protein
MLTEVVPLSAHGDEGPKKERIAVLIFSDKDVSERTRVLIERDIRNMVVSAESKPKFNGRLYPIEPFFDVGQLSNAKLRSSLRHFNEAQRAFEKGDYDEAKGQLRRAERFYLKGIPFIYNGNEELLQNIYYLNFLTHRALKKTKKSRDLYCKYVSLSRNITRSVGSIDQYDVLAEMCGESPISGTAELKVKSNVDGAYVYINNDPVGLVDQERPYINPFLPSGVHLVEIRKLGYARWGKLVTLRNGKSKKLNAKLKRGRNYNKDFMPFSDLKVRGEDAFSETYLSTFFYERTYRFRVNTLIVGYLSPSKRSDEAILTLLSFRDEMLGPKLEEVINIEERNSYYPMLARYWKMLFDFELQPQEMQATQSRWMPTFFKVE